jgi:dienelactone hydrolase
MKLRNVLLATAGFLAIAAGSSAVIAAPMPIDQAAKLFATRGTAFAPDISPNGDKLIYLGAGSGAVTYLHVRDIASGKDDVIAQSDGQPEQLSSCAFADETWAICYLHGDFSDGGIVFGASRVVAVDTGNGKVIRLGAADHSIGHAFVQFDGKVIDWLPEKPGAVLMERTYPNAGNTGRIGYGVDEIDLDPFKVTQVEHTLGRDVTYMTDGHGAVRMKSEAEVDRFGHLTGKTSYLYRRAGSSDWLPLAEGGKDFSPISIDRDSDSLYFAKPLNGRDALYRVKLDGSNAETLVASNPNVDIDSVLRVAATDPIVGYRYTDDRTHSVYFDAATKSLADSLAQALPDLPLIDIMTRATKGSKILIHAASDVDPGAYYLLDQKTKQMTPDLESNKFIDASTLAPMKAVSVPTSDGKSIPAYLTMRGDLGAGPHPAVVLPHGGPTARDAWGYDWLVQFLAARGYVVIQPNYRGSGGYGKEFLGDNAFREWKQVMSDIRDSADWLEKQGLADPKRMAVVGWSYGGYAALESAALDPRYKAVVAIAPVTGLKQLAHERRGFMSASLVKDEIGKGDQLDDGSPINRASDIHAPVLLVHGTLDGNVSYGQSKRMLDALKDAGDKADLLTFTGLDHQLADSTARTEMLTRIGELLDRTIGH